MVFDQVHFTTNLMYRVCTRRFNVEVRLSGRVSPFTDQYRIESKKQEKLLDLQGRTRRVCADNLQQIRLAVYSIIVTIVNCTVYHCGSIGDI